MALFRCVPPRLRGSIQGGGAGENTSDQRENDHGEAVLRSYGFGPHDSVSPNESQHEIGSDAAHYQADNAPDQRNAIFREEPDLSHVSPHAVPAFTTYYR